MVKYERDVDVLLYQMSVSLIIVFLIFLAGCGTTKPSRFYTLNSLQTPETARQVTLQGPNISIGIDPVEIPDYLDRPQIVSRSSQNELNIAEFDRWAASLQDDIARVLAENLSILLGGYQITFYPVKPGSQTDYRIKIDITRFDIMPDDTVSIKAQWAIRDKDRASQLTMRESSFSERIEGRSYSDKAAAMSRALAGLSRDIADEIKSISKGSIQ
jgi:hypothetical protein